MRLQGVLFVVGVVLVIESLFMFVSAGVGLVYGGEDFQALGLGGLLSLISGGIFFFTGRTGALELRHREGFLAVTLTWAMASLFGAVPYLLAGTFDTLTDAYFEAMAGFTTTGSSVLRDIESEPKGILFWRSITQWLGGMGIVLFSLAVVPVIGGGLQLFKAEVPEITVEKLRPRLIDTAKTLWKIYAILTTAAAVLYLFGGMDLYDSICHAFTTLATGGFSTKNASMAHFGSAYVDAVATIFMFLAGINYTLYFYAMKGEYSRFLKSDEFRFYVGATVVATVMVGLSILETQYSNPFEALRYAVFQVVSIMTTTGYATADYEKWSYFCQVLIVVLMFLGGMIGSTGGGIKQVRILLIFRQIYRELYHLIHPRAVTSLKLDERAIPKEVLGSIWGFVFLFITIWTGGTLVLTATGLDPVTAASAMASAVCNVGPALGTVGPAENYYHLPGLAKWVLSFGMLAGRLEVYTVVLLFIPQFWKR